MRRVGDDAEREDWRKKMRIHKGDIVRHFKREMLTTKQIEDEKNCIYIKSWITQSIQKRESC